MENTKHVCLTCGITFTGWGNNPQPINDHPLLDNRRVCDDCNAMYVIPARLGHEVSGDLYSVAGDRLGTFGTMRESA